MVAEEDAVPDHPGEDRPQRQHPERDQHGVRALVRMVVRVMVAPRLAEEGHEDQPPRIEAGEERRDHQQR